MNRTPFFGGICITLCLCSCSVYHSSPINLNAEESTWEAISRSISPTEITQDQARIIGLILNTELNKARLKSASSEKVAKQSGWWNDPSFSWGIEKVLHENTINTSGNIGFTIPVSGLPRLEKETAELYKEADFWTLQRTELDFLSTLDQAWDKLSITQQRQQIIQERISSLRQENNRLEQLMKAGETEFSVLQTETQRLHDAIRELQDVTETALEQKSELIKLLGLHPSSLKTITFRTRKNFDLPSSIPIPTPNELLRSPQIKAQLATYAVSEAQLKTEIRRQYPELELGPTLTRDDGEKELGGDIAFSLPLWNHNRKAIAEAQGNRDLSKLETIQLWKNELYKAQQLDATRQLSLRQGKAEIQRICSCTEDLQTTEKLYQIGETSLAELAESRHRLYESRLTFLDKLEKLLTIQTQICYLSSDAIIIKNN